MTNKTIERAENLIRNKIYALQQKVENVKERWPEELYGLRWMEKTDKYEKEIEELNDYLKNRQFSKNELEQVKRERAELFQTRMLLKDTVAALRSYGEYGLADKLEREIKRR